MTVIITTPEEQEKMRELGKLVAEALDYMVILSNLVSPPMKLTNWFMIIM